jgi:hypothetical protein
MSSGSEHKIDILLLSVEAYNARDVEAMLAHFDPAVELRSAFADVGGGFYSGHDGVRAWHSDMQDAWGNEIRVEPERYFVCGEALLMFWTVHGRGSHSGADVAMPGALVTKWRGERMIYWRSYAQREDALHDLGVTEADLEPVDP